MARKPGDKHPTKPPRPPRPPGSPPPTGDIQDEVQPGVGLQTLADLVAGLTPSWGKGRGSKSEGKVTKPPAGSPAPPPTSIPSSATPPSRGSGGSRGRFQPPPQMTVGLGQAQAAGGMQPTTGLSTAVASALKNMPPEALEQLLAEGMGGGAMGPMPQRSPQDFINDLLNALMSPGPGAPMGIPAMAMGAQQAPLPAPPALPPQQMIAPQSPTLKFGPPQMPVAPALGPVNPPAIGAAADRLTGMAGAMGALPGLNPQQTALNIPWITLGFGDHNQGAAWAQEFFNNYGMWPWEGPGSEEENLGRNLASYYSYNAGYDADPYADPYYSEAGYTPGSEVYANPEAAWFDWGGGGGGWGAYNQEPYYNPWFYANMQGGV